jgi:hypothetical protein
MSRRQLDDEAGRRWDVEDEGPLGEETAEGLAGGAPHQLRFIRDDGTERVREEPHAL